MKGSRNIRSLCGDLLDIALREVAAATPPAITTTTANERQSEYEKVMWDLIASTITAKHKALGIT